MNALEEAEAIENAQCVIVADHLLQQKNERIRDLESTLAARDQRIAELESFLAESQRQVQILSQRYADASEELARAPTAEAMIANRDLVPEWCQPFVAAVYRAANSDGGSVGGVEADELLDGVSKDQLRACGIEVE